MNLPDKKQFELFAIEPKKIGIPDLDALTPDRAAYANRIITAIGIINNCKITGKRTDLIKKWADDLGISVAKMYKLRQAYNQTKSVAVLVVRKKRTDSGQLKNWSPEALLALVREYGQSKSKNKAYEKVFQEASEKGWKIGSASSAGRFLVRIDENAALNTYIHEGTRGLINKIIPSNLRDYSTLSVNEYLCGDHHLCDLFVFDPQLGKVYRPWLTAWEEMRTRAISGYCIVRTPSSRSIAQALQHAIQPGGRKRHFGIPKYVYIDNGKDYKCHYLCGESWKEKRFGKIDFDPMTNCVLAELGIEPVFAIPFNPQSKPIERFFRTVESSLISQLPGYCGNKPESRNAHKLVSEIEHQKLMTMDEFKMVFETWLENKYHARGHQGDGMDGKSPNQVWDEYWQTVKQEPLAIADPRVTYHLFLKRKPEATIHQHGVLIDNTYYYNPIMMYHVGQIAEVRYDPDDPSEVQVYAIDAKTGEITYLCPATPFQKAGWGMPKDQVAERIIAQRQAKKFIIGAYESLIGPRQVNNAGGPGNFQRAIKKYEDAVDLRATMRQEQLIKDNRKTTPESHRLPGLNLMPPDDYLENGGRPESKSIFDLYNDEN